VFILFLEFVNLHSYVFKGKTKHKQPKLEDVLNLLASGYLKGGIGFLKSSSAGEMIKGSAAINREIRVGVTHVSNPYLTGH